MRLMVQQNRYLRSISRTPILSAKCCVKKCGLYSGKYGNFLGLFPIFAVSICHMF